MEKTIQKKKKNFHNWVKLKLKERNIELNELEDLCDSLNFVNLIEILSNRPIAKYNKNPKMKVKIV